MKNPSHCIAVIARLSVIFGLATSLAIHASTPTSGKTSYLGARGNETHLEWQKHFNDTMLKYLPGVIIDPEIFSDNLKIFEAIKKTFPECDSVRVQNDESCAFVARMTSGASSLYKVYHEIHHEFILTVQPHCDTPMCENKCFDGMRIDYKDKNYSCVRNELIDMDPFDEHKYRPPKCKPNHRLVAREMDRSPTFECKMGTKLCDGVNFIMGKCYQECPGYTESYGIHCIKDPCATGLVFSPTEKKCLFDSKFVPKNCNLPLVKINEKDQCYLVSSKSCVRGHGVHINNICYDTFCPGVISKHFPNTCFKKITSYYIKMKNSIYVVSKNGEKCLGPNINGKCYEDCDVADESHGIHCHYRKTSTSAYELAVEAERLMVHSKFLGDELEIACKAKGGQYFENNCYSSQRSELHCPLGTELDRGTNLCIRQTCPPPRIAVNDRCELPFNGFLCNYFEILNGKCQTLRNEISPEKRCKDTEYIARDYHTDELICVQNDGA